MRRTASVYEGDTALNARTLDAMVFPTLLLLSLRSAGPGIPAERDGTRSASGERGTGLPDRADVPRTPGDHVGVYDT